ncbi:MAG: hypothetical protein KKD77_24365 [Gammaproteobacteria bacterium]|nr:hypothetical protein [Gammaproteobacteria bacterium]
MANPVNWIKLKALTDFIDKVEVSKIADLLEDFARKYFGDKWDESMRALQTKLAALVVEIQRRIK